MYVQSYITITLSETFLSSQEEAVFLSDITAISLTLGTTNTILNKMLTLENCILFLGIRRNHFFYFYFLTTQYGVG